MKYTINLKLKKPDYTDPSDIMVINENMYEMDNQIKANADAVENMAAADVGAETPVGAQAKANTVESNANSYTNTKIGEVNIALNGKEATFTKNSGFNLTKSDSVTSPSTSALSTSKAVKTAYDKGIEALNRANEAFTSASNLKSKVATAITGMGQTASSGNTSATLATKISSISKDANELVDSVLSGKTFYAGGVKQTGTMPIAPPYPNNWTASGFDVYDGFPNGKHTVFMLPPKGYYSGADWIGVNDLNLKSHNIKHGVSIGAGVKLTGTFSSDGNIVYFIH